MPDDLPPFDDSIAPDAGVAPPNDACTADMRYPFNNDFNPYVGGESSVEVEAVHFSSFYCIHCAIFSYDTKLLWDRRADFRSGARLYFHHMNWGYRHRASVAAANQGEEHFWAIHDFIFNRMRAGSEPSDGQIRSFVRDELRLDMEAFDRDVEDKQTYAYLVWDIEQGLNAGVQGTPAVYVCGRSRMDRGNLEFYIDDYL